MKKLLAVIFASFLGLTLAACGSDACDDLQSQCDTCANSGAQDACNGIVTLGIASDAACQTALDADTYKEGSTLCAD